MLGLAKGSQYSGWWGGALKPKFDNISTITKSIYNTPSKSARITNSDGSYASGAGMSNPQVDITGLTSAANYNGLKSLFAVNVYLDWASGASDNDNYWNWGSSINYNGSGITNDNFVFAAGVSSGNLFIRGGRNNTVPQLDLGTYTNYTGKWLTFVYASSNSQSDFAGHTESSDDVYTRLSVYETDTLTLLGTADGSQSSSSFVQLQNMSGNTLTVKSSTSNTGTDEISWYTFGNNTYQAYFNMMWFTYGQMIDPANIPNTSADLNNSIFSNSPSPVLQGSSNAVVAMVAIGLRDVETPANYELYWTGSNSDKYSEDNDRYLRSSPDPAFTAYSTTLYPKDNS